MVSLFFTKFSGSWSSEEESDGEDGTTPMNVDEVVPELGDSRDAIAPNDGHIVLPKSKESHLSHDVENYASIRTFVPPAKSAVTKSAGEVPALRPKSTKTRVDHKRKRCFYKDPEFLSNEDLLDAFRHFHKKACVGEEHYHYAKCSKREGGICSMECPTKKARFNKIKRYKIWLQCRERVRFGGMRKGELNAAMRSLKPVKYTDDLRNTDSAITKLRDDFPSGPLFTCNVKLGYPKIWKETKHVTTRSQQFYDIFGGIIHKKVFRQVGKSKKYIKDYECEIDYEYIKLSDGTDAKHAEVTPEEMQIMRYAMFWEAMISEQYITLSEAHAEMRLDLKLNLILELEYGLEYMVERVPNQPRGSLDGRDLRWKKWRDPDYQYKKDKRAFKEAVAKKKIMLTKEGLEYVNRTQMKNAMMNKIIENSGGLPKKLKPPKPPKQPPAFNVGDTVTLTCKRGWYLGDAMVMAVKERGWYEVQLEGEIEMRKARTNHMTLLKRCANETESSNVRTSCPRIRLIRPPRPKIRLICPSEHDSHISVELCDESTAMCVDLI